MRAEDSALWNDPAEAQKLMRERQGLDDGIKTIQGLTRVVEVHGNAPGCEFDAIRQRLKLLIYNRKGSLNQDLGLFDPGPPQLVQNLGHRSAAAHLVAPLLAVREQTKPLNQLIPIGQTI